MADFEKFLNENNIVLLPGATGTELQRRGYKTKLPLWSASANLDAYDLITEIHEDYFRSGADICITNTFRTTPRAFRKVEREPEAREALKKAIGAAHKAQKSVDRPTFIAGSFAPLEDCYQPELVPDKQELKDEHGLQAEWLASEGIDILWPETINSHDEACAMAQAASRTKLPFIISFVIDEKAKLLDGTPVLDTIKATDIPGRLGIALNCRPVDTIDTAFNQVRESYDGIIGLYANGYGCPHDDLGWVFEENADSVEKYVSSARQWHQNGAKIIGGCCGTTPVYIQALAKSFGKDFSGIDHKAA